MRPKTRTSPTIEALSRRCGGNDDAALPVELAGLAEVVDAVEELQCEPDGCSGICESFCSISSQTGIG